MARIPPIEYAQADAESQRLWDEQVRVHGRMTNMKKTLAHSPVALGALMQWYPLRDRVQAWLGERRTLLFAHAISADTDCLICSTFFRRLLIERGDDPEALALDDGDELIVAIGRQLAKDRHVLSDEHYQSLAARYSAVQIVDLVAFGALMVATNMINNALLVDLDDYLSAFRRQRPQP